ncbi:rRNA maturation RNase YbeY [Candidatus Desulfovibrio trichonymphae]|uniref:YbeY-like metal-dependent hydrolase n=1 Tax=Candidatus Desulfovibrio trichonymphae TaxID=1725232 RepID=A0A1J1E1X8_9BACT|nr:rRNA maturation RNase YbeY [Candidatus Desulfovibrio trichonymphae]BAV91883.1 YbeY-like metal-dependent hydrolase [Candidatus Desulfovibrio trichonymphae]GHU92069.1 endoribonuclease YbeY [Deltaproteobacteria bacterium]GHU95877.1 endoribonuclease YbeY [Deltaproteobacteria bacterium]GHU98932.1 endoribonuclease YbeY [Deltaproteobacteria bacterium]
MHVTADCRADIWLLPFDVRCLALALRTMLQVMRDAGISIPADVNLRLVDDSFIKTANQRFMACVGPTNLLSFPGSDDMMHGVILLSLDTFARECLLYGQKAAEYALMLLSHGLAHLTGFEHGSDMDRICKACRAVAQKNCISS